MIRPSRLIILGAVLVTGAACSGATPTTPERPSNTMAPDAGALMTESPDTTCRGGFTVPNGKTC
jgi:hypothetical protein